MDHSLFLWEYSRAKITTPPDTSLSCLSQISCWENIKNEYYKLEVMLRNRQRVGPSYGSEEAYQLKLGQEAAKKLLVSVQHIIDNLSQVTSFPPMGQRLDNLKTAYGAWELADRIAVDILVGSSTLSINPPSAFSLGIDYNREPSSTPATSYFSQQPSLKSQISVPISETCNPRDLLLGPDPDIDIPAMPWTVDPEELERCILSDVMEMDFRSMQSLLATSALSDVLTPEQTPEREMEYPASLIDEIEEAIFATSECPAAGEDTFKTPLSAPSEVPTPEQTPDPEMESPTPSIENITSTYLSCPHEGCKKVFPRENALQRHISSIHDEKVSVSCPYCLEAGNWNGKRFNRSDNFQRHVKGRHSDISPDDPLIKRALQKLWKAKGVRTSWGKKAGAKKTVAKRR